ncbi:MAG: hypothetical protein ABIE36_03100 [Candidatus Diapherotrites archaeon]
MVKDLKGGMKSDERIPFLRQLILSLEEAELKLEEAYRRENSLQFQNMKSFILKIQNKISDEVSSNEK